MDNINIILDKFDKKNCVDISIEIIKLMNDVENEIQSICIQKSN